MPLALVLAIALGQADLPNEARLTPNPPPPPPPSTVARILLAGAGATLASGASLGVTLLLLEPNPRLDATFATAALSTLLVTGAAFAIHQALGGHGEISLSFLFTAIIVAGTAGIVAAVPHDTRLTPFFITAVGAIPAAAAAVLGLELTNPQASHRVSATVGPTGLRMTF